MILSAQGPQPLLVATAAMGTRFEIVVAADDELETRPVLEEALHEIEQLHARLTRFSPDSLLSHIQRTAPEIPVRLDRATFELFRDALAVQRESDGAFDVTLGTGAFHLDARTCSVRLESGTQLDLGGIAKGFALDRAAAILRDGGVRSALLHGGTSSVLALGAPPGHAAWRVTVAHTRSLQLDLRDSALAVSRPFSQLRDGQPHILDPRNDAHLKDCVAVVTGPSAALCDAWSTALAVLGRAPDSPPAGYDLHIEKAV